MGYDLISRFIELGEVGGEYRNRTATVEDGLQSESTSEFLGAVILGLGIVLVASAAVYISFLAICLLFMSVAG
jgi:hypothetical protein